MTPEVWRDGKANTGAPRASRTFRVITSPRMTDPVDRCLLLGQNVRSLPQMRRICLAIEELDADASTSDRAERQF
jgi:hypothetical protein